MATPQLRFQEFDNKYKQTSFEKLKGFSIKSGKSNNKEESGEYPFYGSTGIIGYKSDYDYTGKAILIARVGANAGSLYQVDGKYSVSDNTLILAASDATNLDYVRELLVKFNLNRLVFGTGQPLVTGGLIKKVVISIPEVKEQTKIASFLSAVDDKIAQLTQEHELLSKYKKGMMQQLFSQNLRFKADDGSDFKNWEERILGEVSTTFSGGTPTSSNKSFYEGQIPFIKSGEISQSNTAQFINELALANSSAKLVKKGDLLYALYGATSGQVAIAQLEGAINQAVLCIRSKTLVTNYLYNFLLFKKEEILSTYLQGGQGNLSASILKEIHIPIPCFKEQTKIANFLFSIDEKIENVATQIDQAKVWKKGLLQQMFV